MDEDSDTLGEVTFDLLLPDEDGSLWNIENIGNGRGRLVAIGNLDRESVTDYIVRILARDGGSPAATATAVVRVTILDVNDIRPQLNRQLYNASVIEGTPVGQIIARVSVCVMCDCVTCDCVMCVMCEGVCYMCICR